MPTQVTFGHLATPPKTSVNLLVIDDAVIHSTIIARIGDKTGFKTKTAASYEEAVKQLREQAFDCITLDLGLGRHAGVEVLRHLATLGYKGTVIIISGAEKYVCDETVKIGRELKLNLCDPIQKPVDLKLLRELLIELKNKAYLNKLALLATS